MTSPTPARGAEADKSLQARLAQRIDAARHRLASDPQVPSTEDVRAGSPRLGSAQERFWIAHQLDPTGVAFSAPIVLHVVGAFDLDAWCDAVAQVVGRHDILRTRYEINSDGRPTPVVVLEGAGRVDSHDFRGPDAESRARARVLSLLQQRFNLAGPPVLADVLTVGDRDHLLMIRMHHTNTDGTSRAILLEELATSYAEHARGEVIGGDVVDGSGSSRAYERFALVQRSLPTAECEAASRYLARVVETVDLDVRAPHDRVRSEPLSRVGGAVSRVLPRLTLDKLAEAGPRGRTTTFVVLLTAYHLLISEWTGAGRFPVAFPVAGRTEAEHERALGCFINTMVVPAVVDPRASFDEQLEVVDRWLLTAMEHQGVPIERAVAGVDSLRGDRGRRLGRFWMDMRPLAPVPSLPGAEVTELPVVPPPVADLSLVVDEGGATVVVTFEFSPDVLGDDTVERLADRFVEIVERASATTKDSGFRVPVDHRLDRVVDRFTEIVGAECHADTDLFAAGGTSLDALTLLERVAGDLRRRPVPELIFACPTPRLLLARILSERPA